MELDAVLRKKKKYEKVPAGQEGEREQVEEILKAATLAPSWKNSQTAGIRHGLCQMTCSKR